MTKGAPIGSTAPANQRQLIEISGLTINNLDELQTVSEIEKGLAEQRGGWIVTANSDIARLCGKHRELRELIQNADLVVADGMPLIWASKILGAPLVARVCGSNLVWSIAQRAAESESSLFLLGGGRPETALQAAKTLKRKFPRLRVSGTYFPSFGFENNAKELATIRATLVSANPDIVYVALGFPKAEKLIHQLRPSHPNTWWIGVGISLSFITGEVQRAPKWMQAIGLEWLHRLSQEPQRLFARYVRHDVPFVMRMLLLAAWVRLRGPPPK